MLYAKRLSNPTWVIEVETEEELGYLLNPAQEGDEPYVAATKEEFDAREVPVASDLQHEEGVLAAEAEEIKAEAELEAKEVVTEAEEEAKEVVEEAAEEAKEVIEEAAAREEAV